MTAEEAKEAYGIAPGNIVKFIYTKTDDYIYAGMVKMTVLVFLKQKEEGQEKRQIGFASITGNGWEIAEGVFKLAWKDTSTRQEIVKPKVVEALII